MLNSPVSPLDTPVFRPKEVEDFLNHCFIGGNVQLVAINSSGRKLCAHGLEPRSERGPLIKWAREKNEQGFGIYYSANEVHTNYLHRKARKEDCDRLRLIWMDLDPIEGRDFLAERGRLQELVVHMHEFRNQPTAIIDSGNGFQIIWQTVEVEATNENIVAYEALGERMECWLAGTDNTSNVDRILRLPGTVNWPNARKKKLGRIPTQAELLFLGDNFYEHD
jgi:hypothetical protein